MNDRFIESREALTYAREALKNGAKDEAFHWAERAAKLAPQSEDPWLILTSVSNPRKSVEYARKALEANPNSPRAKKAMEWAMGRVGGTTQQSKVNSGNVKQVQGAVLSGSKDQARNETAKNPKKRSPILPILLVVIGCGIFMFAAWSAVNSPVLASILSISSAPNETVQRPSFAQVNIAKPSAGEPFVEVISPTAAFTAIPTTAAVDEVLPEVVQVIPTNPPPTLEVSILPTDIPIQPTAVVSIPETTVEPGGISAEIIVDTPTSEYVAPTAVANIPVPSAGNGGEHWIDVDLSQQRVYAYEGDTVVNSFLASTGTWQTPTVTGKFKVWIKVRSQAMSGPGYYLPDVPYVMYFYKDYGLHGAYWHNNFGTPMSHGCVNLTIPDSEWLYNFSSVGTVVNVHY
jgi:lipoprotein-anchoring transpeptidase ErfK/SrfK